MWKLTKRSNFHKWVNTPTKQYFLQNNRLKTTLVHKQKVNIQENVRPNLGYQLKENDEIEGFRVTRVAKIPDFQCKLIQLQHIDSGAQYVHIDRDDSNNVFSISFRTTPFNSTGLPHILEHITLCGSNRYPCRDPFFKMLNRSLATFMNAMTGPDYTMYPFATQNSIDYYNLMSVYLDAVFKPQLRKMDFTQEGWRLEHEDVHDQKTPIVFKGVVFNEMKGVFSENESIFMESILNNILPSHTYGFISGGDPLLIPHLTHKDLVDFHSRYYHPSNSKIYSYGNFDLCNHLKFVNESYLQHYKRIDDYSKMTEVPPEPRWTEPRQKHILGKLDPLAPDKSKQSTLAITYLCDDINNIKETFLLKVLTKLLIDGPNSAFYKSLLESDIGTSYAPATGFESQTRDTAFTVGLQGMKSDHFDKVQDIILSTFDKVINNGFDNTDFENVLHNIELGIKHQQANFGLDLLYNLNSLWNHDGDVVKLLSISDHINDLRKTVKNSPSYLQTSVDEYFKQNPHRLVLMMSPDEKYEASFKEKEAKLLESKISRLTESDLNSVYQDGLSLRKEQEKKEDLSCLPTLKITDIKSSVSHDFVSSETVENVSIQKCILPTNGVSYFRSVIDVSHLSEELKVLLPLFSEIMCQMGTRKHDYRTFDQLIHTKTGGLNVSTHIAENVHDSSKFEEGLCIGSHCLDKNAEGMFDIWNELLNDIHLDDVDRFSSLVRMISGELLNGIADSGHHYAMSSAASLLRSSAYRKEVFSGLSCILKLKEIAQEDDLTSKLYQMKEIKNYLFSKKYMRCAINLSPENERAILSDLSDLIHSIPAQMTLPISNTTGNVDEKKSNCVHYVFPFAVNYTAKSLLAVPYADPDFAVLKVLCRLLTSKYLLPLVREKYGAYGAGASVSPGGVIQFYSYRDPNSLSTLEIFDGAVDWILKSEYKDEYINEAKLGVFQQVDAPQPPSIKGMRLFLYGITDELFDTYRQRLLAVDRESILNVANKYMSHKVAEMCSSKVLIGSENESTKSWTKIYP